MADFGVSFFPSRNVNMPQGPGTEGAAVNPIQQAIRILSLHLPKITGGAPIAPGSLLGAGPQSQSDLLMILQKLLGGGALAPGAPSPFAGGPSPFGGGPPPSLPPPKVIPGAPPGGPKMLYPPPPKVNYAPIKPPGQVTYPEWGMPGGGKVGGPMF